MGWIKKDKDRFGGLCIKGLIQALGVGGYCGLVGVIFWRGNAWFGKMDMYWGPVFFLMLFVVSAMISALIVFYYPYRLFFENKKSEAIRLVLSTAGWLVGLVVIGLVLMAVL